MIPAYKHPFYHIWNGMKQRCYNKNNWKYPTYGGRGIKVCDRWLNSIYDFAEDMGERPKNHSIDRIDNDGNYAPENCRWATPYEQSINRRDIKIVTIDGKQYKAAVLSKKYGIKSDTICERASKGFSFNDVVSHNNFRNLDGLALGAKASSIARKSRTHCKRGHEFTEENTGFQKTGRYCKKCKYTPVKER